MRIAVFSDIHSNHRALGACLAHAEEQGIDGAVFLGDYVSDFACPQKTLELLYDFARRHACRFIRGNREEYMTAYRLGEITGWQDGSASGSLLYTYEGLREEDLDWISTLDNYGEEGFPGGPDLAYCHGAPWKTGGTLPEGGPDTQRRLKDIPGALLLRERGGRRAPLAGPVRPGALRREGGGGGNARLRPYGAGPGVGRHVLPRPSHRGEHSGAFAPLRPGPL